MLQARQWLSFADAGRQGGRPADRHASDVKRRQVYRCVLGSVREEERSEQVDRGYSLEYRKGRNERMGNGKLGRKTIGK